MNIEHFFKVKGRCVPLECCQCHYYLMWPRVIVGDVGFNLIRVTYYIIIVAYIYTIRLCEVCKTIRWLRHRYHSDAVPFVAKGQN